MDKPNRPRLPKKPPRHFRYGPNAREMFGWAACMMLKVGQQAGLDPDALLTEGIRSASRGESGVAYHEVDGVRERCIDGAGLLNQIADHLGIDLTDPVQVETVEEYTRRCLDHYRDCDLG